ncbi:MAG: GlsB/YeaQ/YmgE family stress response membrane protein [Anaerolineales bacterium]|nr:GlsB/YeaQ/YmgE family stress response membrane protein [Anaerolineales bacterium]MCB0008781.1 GlsB/YeaQ/YmgE family stress response membrane protein [Anaerolineales bacterium]MCB0016964.1 GlsB/YeaQ/YmgE family stress response membrane protein [Anaerolineales bacterium]MCB0029341.1 GlsB/YeaQ/YmgE family stress response membrane protein [Anaerolineales bacterium]
MGFFTWIIFGGLAGWIASILLGRNNRMGCLANVIIGVVGAMLGGWLGSILFNVSITGFNFRSLAIAVVGAVILLGVTGWYDKGRRR